MTISPEGQKTRRRIRIGTIAWGAILVGAAVFALVALFGGSIGATAILWSVVGFGALLVLAAIVAAAVRRPRDSNPEHPPIG